MTPISHKTTPFKWSYWGHNHFDGYLWIATFLLPLVCSSKVKLLRNYILSKWRSFFGLSDRHWTHTCLHFCFVFSCATAFHCSYKIICTMYIVHELLSLAKSYFVSSIVCYTLTPAYFITEENGNIWIDELTFKLYLAFTTITYCDHGEQYNVCTICSNNGVGMYQSM